MTRYRWRAPIHGAGDLIRIRDRAGKERAGRVRAVTTTYDKLVAVHHYRVAFAGGRRFSGFEVVKEDQILGWLPLDSKEAAAFLGGWKP